MPKQCTVLHVEKSSASNLSGIGGHYLRTHIPKNADPTKQSLNEHHVNSGNSLTQDVNDHIKKSGVKVRKNSVKIIDVVLSGSHKRMKEIESDPKLFKAWVDENKRFIADEVGAENVKVFSVHRDETTPHIHVTFVPILEKEVKWKNRNGEGSEIKKALSARDFIGGPKGNQRLKWLHDRYAERMKQFGLSRGVEGSRAKHETIKEYYARVEKPIEAEMAAKVQKKTLGWGKSAKVDKSDLESLILDRKRLEKENKELKIDVEIKTAAIQEYNKLLLEEKKKQDKMARRKAVSLTNDVLKSLGINKRLMDDYSIRTINKRGPGYSVND